MELIRERSNSKICIHERVYALKDHSLHWHENYEICMMLNQECRFLVDGRMIKAGPGDMVIIGQGMVHRFFIDKEDTKIRLLQFSPKVLLKAGICVKGLGVHLTAERIRQTPNAERQMRILLDLVKEEGRLFRSEENLYQEYLICAFYSLLIRHFAEDSPENDGNTERQEFYRIVAYINEHFDEEINVNSIAETLFLYRAKLTSIFMKYAGMNIKRYINTLRVDKANMLMNQGYGVSMAAMESGFGCIRSFNLIYKNMTGMTPSDYRRNISAAQQNQQKTD